MPASFLPGQPVFRLPLGAEFVDSAESPCKPPLNTDFFTQIQRIFDIKYKKDIDMLIQHTCKIFGTNFSFSMEDLFTQIEFMLKAFKFKRGGRGTALRTKILKELKVSLKQSIFAILEKSVHDNLKKTAPCKYHENIVRNLGRDATIISFNYDCLIDKTLKDIAGSKWDPNYSYFFPSERKYSRFGFQAWTNDDKKDNSKGEGGSGADKIKLLKLHGSTNWIIYEPRIKNGEITKKGGIRLRERLWQPRGKAHYSIIPPEWNKDIASEGSVFNRIWTEAAESIRKEGTFIFIGFSFTPTDLHAASLFQVAVNKIKRLIIVNPDKEARLRTRKILSKGIDGNTKIIQFDKLEEFAKSYERVKSCLQSIEEPKIGGFGEKDKEKAKEQISMSKPIASTPTITPNTKENV